jgi:hypothetical protein
VSLLLFNLGGDITTGGGFSNLYETPSWQQQAVHHYFVQVDAQQSTKPFVDHSTFAKMSPYDTYNKNGRGYPDLAASGTKFIIVVNSTFLAVSGTSASAPLVAGMISLINADRVAKGKSTLGWINPALYQAKTPITRPLDVGENNCYASYGCCKQGFHGAEGWDPVSGLGIVDYTMMFNYFDGLQGYDDDDYLIDNASPVSTDDTTSYSDVYGLLSFKNPFFDLALVIVVITLFTCAFCLHKNSHNDYEAMNIEVRSQSFPISTNAMSTSSNTSTNSSYRPLTPATTTAALTYGSVEIIRARSPIRRPSANEIKFDL